MKTALPPLSVLGAKGSEIYLEDGRTLIDGIASWWTACHGYGHPALISAVQKQAETLSHIMFAGLTHTPAETLAAKLCTMTGMARAFFVDSGSVAVEVALKMALQFWRNHGQPQRTKFVCFEHGYHGDTLGAMSVSDPEQNFHLAFKGMLAENHCVPLPRNTQQMQAFEAFIAHHQSSFAGLIIEPLVQGAGGMKFHTPDTLRSIADICKKYDILLIADEIATGFGRTGSMFACEQAGIAPDIMCVGKALTGGMMTLAATLASSRIFDGFWSDDASHALMHGPTYMANPLACAVANASIDLFATEPRLEQVQNIAAQMFEELAKCKDLQGVVDVRVMGAIGVVQLEKGRMNRHALRQQFVGKGLWIRPLEDVIYLTPAFTIAPNQLSSLCSGIYDELRQR